MLTRMFCIFLLSYFCIVHFIICLNILCSLLNQAYDFSNNVNKQVNQMGTISVVFFCQTCHNGQY